MHSLSDESKGFFENFDWGGGVSEGAGVLSARSLLAGHFWNFIYLFRFDERGLMICFL